VRPVDQLRSLHRPGDPLVLPNAWDAFSARLVVDAGFPVVATSSAAVARSLGSEDREQMGAEVALAAIGRICGAVDVPVTADFEAGYGLDPEEVVERLLGAGASGCNLEDSDHSRPGALTDPDVRAAWLARIRAAAGDRLVLNARIDTFARGVPDPVGAAIERGRRYVDAGADCVYPINAASEADIAVLVERLGVININLTPGGPPIERLRELGVARVSLGSLLHRVTANHLRAILEELRAGDDTTFRQ
jgi:2-methylisocitrate lyase-like PEP mutase family enzyme